MHEDRTVVYLPSERAHPGDPDVTLQLRRLRDGRLALPAFRTLDALVHGCGPDQPWAGIDGAAFPEVVRRCGVDIVLWDEVLPADPPEWSPGESARRPRGSPDGSAGHGWGGPYGKHA